MDQISPWDGLVELNFAAPWNLTGYPAMTVCTGFGSKQLAHRHANRWEALCRRHAAARGSFIGRRMTPMARPSPPYLGKLNSHCRNLSRPYDVDSSYVTSYSFNTRYPGA